MKKSILFILLVLIWFFLLFPKVILWNYFVDEMEQKDISITAKEVDIKTWLIYNKIEIKELTALKTFKIKTLDITQNILNPLLVEIYGSSEFGLFRGEVELYEKKGYILFETSDLKGAIFKSYFKKTKEGMKYEFNY